MSDKSSPPFLSAIGFALRSPTPDSTADTRRAPSTNPPVEPISLETHNADVVSSPMITPFVPMPFMSAAFQLGTPPTHPTEVPTQPDDKPNQLASPTPQSSEHHGLQISHYKLEDIISMPGFSLSGDAARVRSRNDMSFHL